MALIDDLTQVPSSSAGWLLALLGLYVTYIVLSKLYIAFLHPLSKYPGPRLWALTKIPYDIHFWRGDLPYSVCKLHEKYGPVVRISPNELSYITEDAWNDIYGKFAGKSQLSKKSLVNHEGLLKNPGLFLTTSDTDHARMRRNFSHAFSEKALREQEPTLNLYFDLLIQRLHETCATPVDIVMWFNSTTFDIVGDLLFGESYECLEKSRLHILVALIFKRIKTLRILALLRRVEPLDKGFFWLLSKRTNESGNLAREFHVARVDQRLARDIPRLDFMSHAQKNYNTPEGMNIDEIRQTCSLFVVAGSETTATLLSGVTYLLLKNPAAYRELVKEIRQKFEFEAQITISSVQGLNYELAVLEEGLRSFPPIAGTQCRIVPPAGHVIAGNFVPGNTVVGVNQWSAFHSASNFKNPYKFVPERWLGNPEYKDDKRKVFQPFSVGPRNCLGQNLAYAEMRVILTRVLWNFDIELCEESRDWMENLEVYTLWTKAPLMVKLTPVDRTLES